MTPPVNKQQVFIRQLDSNYGDNYIGKIGLGLVDPTVVKHMKNISYCSETNTKISSPDMIL